MCCTNYACVCECIIGCMFAGDVMLFDYSLAKNVMWFLTYLSKLSYFGY